MDFSRKTIKTFYNNEFVSEKNAELMKVFSPYDGKEIAEIEKTSLATLNQVIESAVKAQKDWASLTFKKRSEVLYRYRELVLKHKQELAHLIHLDNGKTMGEALAEVEKVIELTDFACSIPQLVSGETQWVSRGIIAREERRPVGVFAVITPFNFPLMVPNWSIPNAIALGNAVVLKPSEITPLATSYMADLWKEAGLPSGIFNLVNGGSDISKALIEHDEISGVTFVGSTPVAKIVYETAALKNKRVIALGGAKNHLFALKDAQIEIAAKEILASAVGMAGQRCMAVSVALIVGENQPLLDALVTKAREFKLGQNFPPIVSKVNIDKMKKYVENARQLGAKILVDGAKEFTPPTGAENGYWYGPTLIDWTGLEDKMSSDEVFGPVLEIVQMKNISDAIKFQHKSPLGNAASVFTQSGRAAEEIIKEMKPGMLGVNIGVPVPREPFSFGGLLQSKFGYGDITGKSSINFFTNLVKVTTKWNPEDKTDWMS
ncbi:aldehyde dehydrogenase family protein [Candidatus Mycoplasma pogonae]